MVFGHSFIHSCLLISNFGVVESGRHDKHLFLLKHVRHDEESEHDLH